MDVNLLLFVMLHVTLHVFVAYGYRTEPNPQRVLSLLYKPAQTYCLQPNLNIFVFNWSHSYH